jgi:hypothetical protein
MSTMMDTNTTTTTTTTTQGQGSDRFPPGTIRIGWRDRRVPMDTPITPREVVNTEAMRKAAAHLAVEWGAQRALRSRYNMARFLRRIARIAARDGLHLVVHSDNVTTSPEPWSIYGLGLGIWAVGGDRMIRWMAKIYATDDRIMQYDPGDGVVRWARRADAAVRRMAVHGHPLRAEQHLRKREWRP